MEDVLLDDDYDLAIGADGDLVVGSTFMQEQKLLLATDKNDWKENSDIGVGLENFLEDEDPEMLYAEIREQYAKTGMSVKQISVENGKILIERK